MYDPLRFLPERSNQRDSFAYMPFSAGPRCVTVAVLEEIPLQIVCCYRNCIGQVLALNEESCDKFNIE